MNPDLFWSTETLIAQKDGNELHLLRPPLPNNVHNELKNIFWTTSTKTEFQTPEQKTNFQKKYFDDYIILQDDSSLCILNENHSCLGYLFSCSHTLKSLEEGKISPELYSDPIIPFLQNYPAHFHIDFLPQGQGQGLGSWALDIFEKRLQQRGIPGIHVQTLLEHPSCHFYQRKGYTILQQYPLKAGHLALLGKLVIDS